MGFFSDFADDVLGLDPGGGGIYSAARDVLGSTIADDILGMDPSGKGAIGLYNAVLPLVGGYFALDAAGGIDYIKNLFGSGTGAEGSIFSDAQLAAANASADPIQYLANTATYADVSAGGGAASSILGTLKDKGASALGFVKDNAGWLAPAASAVAGMYGANKAAQTQSDAAKYAADLQNLQYQQTRQDLMPWMTAGKTALNKLVPLATEYTPFAQTDWQQDPGYAFRMSEGLKALDRQAAARGGLISGAALKGAQRYGQDLASQEYQNAFNRYQAERTAQLNPLQSLAGVGQTTANQLGSFGSSTAANVGNLTTSGAAAQAAGTMGAVNALAGGVNQYLNYQQNQANNALLQQALTRQSTYGG